LFLGLELLRDLVCVALLVQDATDFFNSSLEEKLFADGLN
jgi:hypothetical protein